MPVMDLKFDIDVVIPAYNAEKYILHAIASVEEQTYRPKKVIVVDDGSTDSTQDIVRGRRSATVPVEYVRKSNGGPNSARNAGLQVSSSEFVAFLDADDLWKPDKLKEQITVFQKSGDDHLGVVYCNYDIIDANGNVTNKYPAFQLDHTVKGDVFEALLQSNRVAGSASAVLIRRSCFQKAGMFDETLKIGEDWDMWLRLAEHCNFDFVDKPLISIRRHDENTQSDQYYVFAHELIFYNKWAVRLDDHEILHIWGKKIADLVLRNFPSTLLLSTVKRSLTPTARKQLFKVTFGSIRLFLLAKISVGFMKNIWNNIRSILSVVRSIKAIFVHLITAIRDAVIIIVKG